MVVVIRLQGLRITAGSEDIRKFFTGLKIPDGGVHIIGGEREEAFIIFASDEDARRAMTRSGGLIQDSPVTLLLSSKAEMQNLLERSTKNMEQAQERQFERHRSADPEMGRGPGSKMGSGFPPEHQMAPNNGDGSCLFLKGLPFSVTEKEISDFFHGLFIDDIFLMKRPNGLNNGKGFIKFASREDAQEGLKRDKEYIGTRYIEIFPTTINDWHRAAGRMPFMRNENDGFERGRSPGFGQRNPPERVRSRSPVAQRHAAPSEDEYCVHLENLSYVAEKENIKQLFHKARLEDDQIMHLFDSEGRRTRSSFVMFKNPRDYCDALNLEKVQFLSRWVQIRPISKENMISLLENESKAARPSGNTDGVQERLPPYTGDSRDSENICVFVRNLPFDVRKVEIMDFFHEFTITEDNVCVLHDHKGAGVGKALVLFGSEAEAMRALSLNGRRFLGSEVILRSISRSQMQELIAEPPEVQQFPPQERFLGRSSESYCPPGDSRHSGVRNPTNDSMPMRNVQGQSHGGFDYESRAARSCSPKDRGNGVRHGFDSSGRNFDVPTCVQLVNLPFQIKPHEIYDFCYGYRIIPGSVSLQYEPTGKSKGSATLVFQSRQEALTAIDELNGRPIGPRKIQLLLV